MDKIGWLLIYLVVIGLALYFIKLIPMDATLQKIIHAILIVVAVLLTIFFFLSLAGIATPVKVF